MHHGKSSLLFGLLTDDDETLKVCDIFDQQEKNVSNSGAGVRSVFESNWHRWLADKKLPEIYQCASAELSSKNTGTNYRLFSIDGGHTAQETEADMMLADRALHKKGMMIIDDYFDAAFPGVSEGVNRFLNNQNTWRPLMYGFNKMFLVRSNALAEYRQAFNDDSFLELCSGRRYVLYTQQFFATEFVTVRQSGRAQDVLRSARRKIARSPVMPVLEKSGIKKIYGMLIRPRE